MHFPIHSEDFCESFVMFSGVTEVQLGGFIGDAGFWMTQHRCHRDSLGNKFSHSSCWLILCAYMISSQNFQTHYFPCPVGPLWNFPIFSRNFKLVTCLSFDFWDFIYAILNRTKRNFHRGSPQSDGKQIPTKPRHWSDSADQGVFKMYLQPGTWNPL